MCVYVYVYVKHFFQFFINDSFSDAFQLFFHIFSQCEKTKTFKSRTKFSNQVKKPIKRCVYKKEAKIVQSNEMKIT